MIKGAHPRKPPDPAFEGGVFGRLTVITWIPTYDKHHHWLCQCSCGERTLVPQHRLTQKLKPTRSCGCLRKEPWAYKHGDKGSRLYGLWCAMKKRCYQVGSVNYHNYGGRGIVLCDQWRDDYRAFKAWSLANGYEAGLSIDRIDNDGIYSPENCRWVTRLVNQRNRRNSCRIVVYGEEMAVGEAAERFGVSYDRIKARLRAGYSPEEAVSPGVDPLGRRANGTSAMLAAATPLTRARGHATRRRRAAFQNTDKAAPPRAEANGAAADDL